MGIGGISVWQLLIILLIVVMLFGTKRLRTLGGDLGSAVKGFRKSMSDDDGDKETSNDDIAGDNASRMEADKDKSASMFDIGFAELVIIAIVGLLVIGPERLPGTVRTASAWLGRLRRGFNDIKREVQQELHNDAVMQELKRSGEQLKEEADGIGKDVQAAINSADADQDQDSK